MDMLGSRSEPSTLTLQAQTVAAEAAAPPGPPPAASGAPAEDPWIHKSMNLYASLAENFAKLSNRVA